MVGYTKGVRQSQAENTMTGTNDDDDHHEGFIVMAISQPSRKSELEGFVGHSRFWTVNMDTCMRRDAHVATREARPSGPG